MATATKQSFKTIDIIYCGLFTALIAIGAFIKIMIPLGLFEVTFSLQFLFALLAGFLLGHRTGGMSVAVYLIVGLLGIPIFAYGGGLGYLMRPTFGFLIGFLAAAFIAGLLTEKMDKYDFKHLVAAGFIGEMAYYACGLIYYFVMFNYILADGAGIGVVELLSVWFLSTVVPDFVLVIVASLLAVRLKPLMDKASL